MAVILAGVYVSDELSGIFVRSIAPGSAAALDGRIQVSDQIIAVSNLCWKSQYIMYASSLCGRGNILPSAANNGFI